ncbi:MAG TPA: DUF4388 domain-containing protein [Ktedonobacteraceae bacterium]|jgi:hypothetical protein|nr:DUF4388 domain-containing protein [Ktedonobacteraceae bacterium]
MVILETQGTSTHQIMNIIQIIQLEKKSGQLTMERGEKATTEQGEITFVNGQITQAQCGQKSGQQALYWIHSWGSCRFLFTPTVTETSLTLFSPTTSIPRRIRQDNEALYLLKQAGLSRLHRQVFSLIDGKRSYAELMRLTTRQPEEMRRLVLDLERIGIVQQ